MDFHTYTTPREACSKAGFDQHPDAFYETGLADALAIQSAQFYFQLNNERDWEHQKRPYYNVWRSIVPMLIVVTVELYDCDGGKRHVRNPERATRLRKPKNHPQQVWFNPF